MSTRRHEERITFHEGFDGLPVFSPDGKRLMWTSSGRTADRKSQLFIADFNLNVATRPAEKAAARLNAPDRQSNERRQSEPKRRIRRPWDPKDVIKQALDMSDYVINQIRG